MKKSVESSSFEVEVIQLEVARKQARWDSNMEMAEKVVYSSFLVSTTCTREVGVDIERIVKLPMIDVKLKM